MAEFTIDETGINALYREDGDVGRHVSMVRAKIVFLAKRYVGKRTRRLEQSISARTVRMADGILLEVSASAPYALDHHNGTRPHLITPNNHRVMRFKSSGRVVYARTVRHPGTRPNPFLLRALREAVGE